LSRSRIIFKETALGFAGTIKRICDEKRVKSDTVIVQGHPVEEILKTAKQAKADSHYHGFPWPERLGRRHIGQRDLRGCPQGVENPDSHCPEVMKGGSNSYFRRLVMDPAFDQGSGCLPVPLEDG